MRILFFICFTIISTVLTAQDQSDPIITEQINQQVWEPFKEAYATSNGPIYVAVHAHDVLRITK
ncbi:MAG: hypothetical protein AB8F74_13330 [Saprospiraceae bacterium]